MGRIKKGSDGALHSPGALYNASGRRVRFTDSGIESPEPGIGGTPAPVARAADSPPFLHEHVARMRIQVKNAAAEAEYAAQLAKAKGAQLLFL